MEIRRAGAGDLDAVAALEDECEGRDAWSRTLLADGLAGTVPTVSYLVAQGESDIVGYAVVSCIDDVAELQRIGVTSVVRRSGVGSQLLEQTLGLARKEGAQRLLLEVREDNRAAIAMYAAHGFVEIDRRPRYYRDGAAAIVMRIPVTKGCGW